MCDVNQFSQDQKNNGMSKHFGVIMPYRRFISRGMVIMMIPSPCKQLKLGCGLQYKDAYSKFPSGPSACV